MTDSLTNEQKRQLIHKQAWVARQDLEAFRERLERSQARAMTIAGAHTEVERLQLAIGQVAEVLATLERFDTPADVKAEPYRFEPYDVVQVQREGRWLDFSTVRTGAEALMAQRMVDTGWWDGQTLAFRIVRNTPRPGTVVYGREG